MISTGNVERRRPTQVYLSLLMGMPNASDQCLHLLPRDPYKILNVAPDSTAKEIRRAYHAQLLLHHPDKQTSTNPSTSNAKRLTVHDIQQAYQLLAKERVDVKVEEDGIVVGEVVGVWEMTEVEGGGYAWDCRCGEEFFVESDEKQYGEVVAVCSGCSLGLKVVFGREMGKGVNKT